MFAFDRSAIAVLAPLALLVLVAVVSNYSAEPRAVQAMQQPEVEQPVSETPDREKHVAMVAHNARAASRH